MKALIAGLTVVISTFAPLALAKDKSISEANRTAVTAPASGTYDYAVRHDGHDGRLVFGTDEVSWIRNDRSDKGMSWNYNMLKKVKTDSNQHHLILVMHGGETQTFKLTGNEPVASDLHDVVATRIAAAPRYNSWK